MMLFRILALINKALMLQFGQADMNWGKSKIYYWSFQSYYWILQFCYFHDDKHILKHVYVSIKMMKVNFFFLLIHQILLPRQGTPRTKRSALETNRETELTTF